MKRIKIISLAHDVERRKAISQNLTDLGLQDDFEFIDAVSWETIDKLDNPIEEIKTDWKTEKIEKAGYATSLSHAKAVQKAKDDGLEIAVILEDDCFLKVDPFTLIDHEKEWDAMIIGGRYKKHDNGYVRSAHFIHCQILKKEMFDTFIRCITMFTDVSDENLNYSKYYWRNKIVGIDGYADQRSEYSNILFDDLNKVGLPYNANRWETNIRVVSIPESPRRKIIEKHLDKLGVTDYEFVDALNGKSFPDSMMTNISDNKDAWRTLEIRKRGYANTLSHIKAIDMAKKEGLPWVMILEDDCYFDPFPWDIIKNLPMDWDAVMIGADFVKTTDETFEQIYAAYYPHCLLIHSRIYDRFIELMKFTDSFDENLKGDFYQFFKVYAVKGYAYQNESYSQILDTESKVDRPYLAPKKIKFAIKMVSKFRSANNYLENTIASIGEKCEIYTSDFKEDTPYGNEMNGNPIHFYTQYDGFENHLKVHKSVPIHYVYNFQRVFDSCESLNENEKLILLEDDLEFSTNWLQKTKSIINEIEKEYDDYILNLYCPYDYVLPHVGTRNFIEYDLSENFNKHYGCQATIWSKKLALDFARFNREINFNSFRIQDDSIIFQMDHLMAIYAEYKGIPILTTVPSLVQHMGFKTSGVAQFMHQSPSYQKD